MLRVQPPYDVLGTEKFRIQPPIKQEMFRIWTLVYNPPSPKSAAKDIVATGGCTIRITVRIALLFGLSCVLVPNKYVRHCIRNIPAFKIEIMQTNGKDYFLDVLGPEIEIFRSPFQTIMVPELYNSCPWSVQSGPWFALGTPKVELCLYCQVVLGVVRTQIVDTAMFGPINVNDIMGLTANTPNDLQTFWPATSEEKLQWLARYGLIANSQTCPDVQCGANQAMHLINDDNVQDKYIVSSAVFEPCLCIIHSQQIMI